MTIYYRGTDIKKVGEYDIGFTGNPSTYKFFTTKIDDAKTYGPIVQRVDINYSNPYIAPTDSKDGPEKARENWLKKWGLYSKWAMMSKKTLEQWETLVFDEAKRRGYDAVIWKMDGGFSWCIPLKGDIVKVKDILGFKRNPGGYMFKKESGKKIMPYKLKPAGKISVRMVMGNGI